MSDSEPPDGADDAAAERSAEYLRALDLHDETGQLLTAILVNLRHLARGAPGTGVPATVRDTELLVETLFASIRTFMREARRGGSGPAPTRADLGPALRSLAGDFSRRTGIDVRLRYDDDAERVSGEHKAVLFRIVQESLTNVFRHSAASRVGVSFRRTPSTVELVIEEDPASAPRPGTRTLPPAATAGSGSGLRGMRDRVRLIGGECAVTAGGRGGMTVRVTLPYNIQ